MADHHPAGYCTLADAFARFQRAKWGGHFPIPELQAFAQNTDVPEVSWVPHFLVLQKADDLDRQSFAAAFGVGDVIAEYRQPGSIDRFENVPQKFWQKHTSPELMFLVDTVASYDDFDELDKAGKTWSPDTSGLEDRAAFVEKIALDAWIAEYLKWQTSQQSPVRSRWVVAKVLLDLVRDKVLSEELLEAFANGWLLPPLPLCATLSEPDARDDERFHYVAITERQREPVLGRVKAVWGGQSVYDEPANAGSGRGRRRVLVRQKMLLTLKG